MYEKDLPLNWIQINLLKYTKPGLWITARLIKQYPTNFTHPTKSYLGLEMITRSWAKAKHLQFVTRKMYIMIEEIKYQRYVSSDNVSDLSDKNGSMRPVSQKSR